MTTNGNMLSSKKNLKIPKDKQRCTKHTHKATDRVTRTPLKTGMNSCDPEG